MGRRDYYEEYVVILNCSIWSVCLNDTNGDVSMVLRMRDHLPYNSKNRTTMMIIVE